MRTCASVAGGTRLLGPPAGLPPCRGFTVDRAGRIVYHDERAKPVPPATQALPTVEASVAIAEAPAPAGLSGAASPIVNALPKPRRARRALSDVPIIR